MNSEEVLRLISIYESRNITLIEPDGSWPIVWDRAQDVNVWDIEGRKFLDLTAAFGVAATGHANAKVVKAGQQQMARLLHGMADVHPHALKAELAQLLSKLTFERWAPPTTGKMIFCNSGFEAVEAAMKTALLATGRPEIIAFQDAYHGLGYGALNVTHREHFRSPFRAQLHEFGHFVKFPTEPEHLAQMEAEIRKKFRKGNIGAILAEPIQGRGGINVPPEEFLPRLRTLCDEFKALLILDEIYTGFGRTGKWFACEHCCVVPDIICLGKGLTGGFPLSVCIGRADLMDEAWPPAMGDPIHTSTFMGHPVGCAMAIAQIDEIIRLKLISESGRLGHYLYKALSGLNPPNCCSISVRGVGLLVGIELRLPDGTPATDIAMNIVKRMLDRGFIVLPDGAYANTIEFTPPLTITEQQLAQTTKVLGEILATI
jgi:4-aminobutyrate aminotransferase-like enzyme